MKLSFKLNTKVFDDKIRGLSEQDSELFLFDLMNSIKNHAKRIVPVDTGTLKNSIHIFPMNPAKKITLADGVKYGKYVEFGTSKMKAQPFFRPALAIAMNWDFRQIADKFK